jgi:hypothetical protein
MLVSLSDIKAYLGIPSINTTYDAFLTEQGTIVSDAIEAYCGRKLISDEYIQTFYREDFNGFFGREIKLFHYPLSAVTYIKLDETELELSVYRIQKPIGMIVSTHGLVGEKLEVRYNAGFATTPSLIRNVVLNIVEQNYNKKISGVSTNFGSDVQRISIAGVMSLDFDYTLDSNQRKNAYGVIVGQYLNVLDQFRSERVVIGSGRITYVDEA